MKCDTASNHSTACAKGRELFRVLIYYEDAVYHDGKMGISQALSHSLLSPGNSIIYLTLSIRIYNISRTNNLQELYYILASTKNLFQF